MTMRDEFLQRTKESLAKRVGMLCSNPDCCKPTSGPCNEITKALNIGVAAHITAASPGGLRYDPSLSDAERSAIENGIWLCQNCAKLVDNDPVKYTVECLRDWKLRAEQAAQRRVESICAPTDSRQSSNAEYARRRSDMIERALADFEPIHAFFFKVCIDYMSLVQTLRTGFPATTADWNRYSGFITEIGVRLHEMHLIEGRLRVAGANKAVTALQQYRLQATDVNDMLSLLRPKLTQMEVRAVADELFRRKDRFYEELAEALQLSASLRS